MESYITNNFEETFYILRFNTYTDNKKFLFTLPDAMDFTSFSFSCFKGLIPVLTTNYVSAYDF